MRAVPVNGIARLRRRLGKVRAVIMPGMGVNMVGFDREEEEKCQHRRGNTECQPSIEMQKRHYPHTLCGERAADLRRGREPRYPK